MIIYEWDHAKAESNRRKHGISFEEAMEVFDDAYGLSEPNRFVDGERRWLTIGVSGAVVILSVAHTVEEHSNDEVVRIISARRASGRERRRYGENRQKEDG